MHHPIRVLRTVQLHQADMAAAALHDAGVPHQLRQESSNGIEVPMGVDPGIAFGTVWSVLVPNRFAKSASELLATLPFEVTPQLPEREYVHAGPNLRWWHVGVFVLAVIAFQMAG